MVILTLPSTMIVVIMAMVIVDEHFRGVLHFSGRPVADATDFSRT